MMVVEASSSKPDGVAPAVPSYIQEEVNYNTNDDDGRSDVAQAVPDIQEMNSNTTMMMVVEAD